MEQMEASTSGRSSKIFFISRRDLYDIMKNGESNKREDKIKHLRMELIKRYNPTDMKGFLKRFHNFCTDFKCRWHKANRSEKQFFKKNLNWLNASISFAERLEPPTKRGSTEISFEECKDNIIYATQMSLRRTTKYQKYVKKVPQQLSAEEALAVLVEAKLTRSQYNVIRNAAPDKFPSYTKIQQAKQKYYHIPQMALDLIILPNKTGEEEVNDEYEYDDYESDDYDEGEICNGDYKHENFVDMEHN